MSAIGTILSLARAGATSRAWDAFLAAGLEGVNQAESLTLKGRLLKDRARQAAGAERKALFAQSGAAYAQAASLRPDSYPLINAAAMALFAGDGASAAAIARDVLTLVDGDPYQGETPYWREATRAEGLLLLGQLAEAQASLAAAIRLAPRAWEDHAATLRQFSLILEQNNLDTGWLNAHRPPPSLHFSGILGIAPDDGEAAVAINQAIDRIAPGFAYGALAAGADIIAAEHIIARGSELHVVLPISAGPFCDSSVRPFGDVWVTRFDALLDQAQSVTIASQQGGPSRAAIDLADYVAMGMAAYGATLIESRAAALRIEPAERATDHDPWQASGREIIRLALAAWPGAGRVGLPSGSLHFHAALGSEQVGSEVKSFDSLSNALSATMGHNGPAALDSNLDGNVDTVTALLRNALPGGLIASNAAAMALMAAGHCHRIEPLGELDHVDGPVNVFAIWPKGSG